jgi:hypothetical protein
VTERGTLAEAFQLLLRALLPARGLREELADEVGSYEWFRQFQNLWAEPFPRQRPVDREDRGAAIAEALAPLRAAAFEAIELLTNGVKSGAVPLRGRLKPRGLFVTIDVDDLASGDVHIFDGTLKIYDRCFYDCRCFRADVLSLIPQDAAEEKDPAKLARAKEAVAALWPDAVPPATVLPNAVLVARVNDWLKADCKARNLQFFPISPDTILRAAGRKPKATRHKRKART